MGDRKIFIEKQAVALKLLNAHTTMSIVEINRLSKIVSELHIDDLVSLIVVLQDIFLLKLE